MSDNRHYILAHDTARRLAAAACMTMPNGFHVWFDAPKKKRIQEEKYHAMVGDIAKQIEHLGRKWDAESMKRLLVDDFAEEMRLAGTPLRHDGSVTPSLDGRRIVQLGIQTRNFTVKEASAFIEYLNAQGAQYGVVWSERGASCMVDEIDRLKRGEHICTKCGLMDDGDAVAGEF